MSSDEMLFEVTEQDTKQWRLAEVQVANWGTFDGAIYRVPVARRGHLVTGPSGSGKSSLLDAIAAVLTPDKWLRLNQAAQGATRREDQRTTLSYVRGAWSRTVDETEDRVVSAFLRPKATWSGIVLRFEDGAGGVVSLCRLFFLRATASTAADMSDVCLFERSVLDLRDLEPFASSGIEARKIQQQWPDGLVTSNRKHTPFYARLRAAFGIADETALQLLHKTQSAKSLDSLDQLFRDYMLERPGTFSLAETAVEQFGELRDAHDRIVQLRRQRDHLLTMREHAAAYDRASATAAETRTLIDSVGDYQRRRALQLATDELERVDEKLVTLTIAAEKAAQQLTDAHESLRRAERLANDMGGSEVAHLNERISAAQKSEADVRARWAKFEADLRRAGVDSAPGDETGFAELMRAIDEILHDNTVPDGPDHEDQQRLFEARHEHDRLNRAIESLRVSRSTVPESLLRIRTELAEHLSLPTSALPFAAELIEVSGEHETWTGAIERVLRPFSLALLVRSEHLRAVRRWIDERRLNIRLVFEEVATDAPPPRPARSPLSLVNRVRVAEGPFSPWITGQLSDRFDYACVDSPDDLDDHVRAVTVNGQLRTSRTRYEKDDRRRIDDRSTWVLGDREGKLQALLEHLALARKAFDEAKGRVEELEDQRRSAERQRTVFETVRAQSWHDIDREAAAEQVRRLQHQLRSLTDDDASLHAAVAAVHRAHREHTDAQASDKDANTALQIAGSQRAEVALFITTHSPGGAGSDRSEQLVLTDEVVTALERRFNSHRRHLTRQTIAEVGQAVTQQLSGELQDTQAVLSTSRDALVSSATSFNNTWPAAATSAELIATVDDRQGYLDLLDTIVAQGLPDHEENFRRLMRERSRDLIGQLVNDILSAPREIAERVDPVNASLRRSPFDEGRFLKLRVKTRRSETVNRFVEDLRSVSEGSWTDDELESTERRFATLKELMGRLGSSEHVDRVWRQQCLDTRQHVTFLAEEIDSHGRVEATYDSGAAMSGGQQQKLVIFCLAAALRYQLADAEEAFPRFGTIIMDEAFDKADTRYTRMALDIFVEFGFQMVLATPQKLLQTIEPYVGAATSVENPTRRRSVVAEVVWRETAPEATP